MVVGFRPAAGGCAVTQYHYRAWDGTQELVPFTPEDAMDALAEQLLDGSDLRDALNRMMRNRAHYRGGQRMAGMRELLERARERRERTLQRYNLDSVMDDIARQLDEVIDTERGTVEERLRSTDAPQGADDDGKLRDLLRNL